MLGISRAALSYALALVCAICVTLALVRTWMSEAIYDEDRFAGTAVEVLEREDVQMELRDAIVDQVIKQQPDLVAARPIIETVVETAIDSNAFESITANAARDFHGTVFESERQSLILNLSDLMAVATAGVRAYDAQLADRLPGGPDTAAFELATRNTGTEIVEFDRRLAAVRSILVAGAVASLAGSVLAGSSLRRTTSWLGIALVVCAVVVWLAVGIIGDVIERRVGGDEVIGRAAAGAWGIYAEGLVWWMWVQALVGVGMAVVASSLASPPPISERVELMRARWETAWEHRGRRVVLSGGLATIGLVFMVSPAPALHVTAQGVGLGMLYLGGGELVRGLGLAREKEPLRRPARRVSADMVPRILAGAGLLGAVVVGVLVFWVNRDALRADSASAVPEIEQCNGMDQLCDRRIDEVVFAGTHNSMSAAEEPGWYLAEQVRPIRAQLDDGVRAFLIDVYYGYATNRGVRTDPNVGNVVSRLEPWFGPEALAAARNLADAYGPIPSGAEPALYLCHGYCELGATSLDRILSEVSGFMKDHPHEVVMLIFQDYVEPSDVEASFERTRLIDFVYTLEPGKPLPTLRRMIEVDRRLLVLSENVGSTPAPAWYHNAFALIQDTPFAFRSVSDFVCDSFRGTDDNPLFLMNHWISRFPPSPKDATTPNSFDVLYERARECQEERQQIPNVIAVDFYETGDLLAVVDALNEHPQVD